MRQDAKVIAQTTVHTGIDWDIVGISSAMMLGVFLIFSSGFVQTTVVHDSAHDLRHTMAFPCH
jgi:cobalt transporter subunit CbtB